jgi:hypothetical protein
MSDQEIKKAKGLPTIIEDTLNDYQGRKKWRALMQVDVDGTPHTMQLDVTMPPSDPNGKPPFEVGKEVEFEYTRREWHPDGDTSKTRYFYNYRWPQGSAGGGGGGRQWAPKGPQITFRASTMPKGDGDRAYSVELSCSPTDNLAERAAQVNGGLNALISMSTATATKPAVKAPMNDAQEPIDEEPPF